MYIQGNFQILIMCISQITIFDRYILIFKKTILMSNKGFEYILYV